MRRLLIWRVGRGAGAAARRLPWRRRAGWLALAGLVLVLLARPVARAFTDEQRRWAASQTGIVYYVHTDVPAVALTFDDGPDPTETPRVLALLRQAGAHATFFVLAQQAQRYPTLVQAEVAEGSEVGDHSISHPNMARLGPDAVRRQAGDAARTIGAIAGRPVTLFRFPYFAHTAIGVAAVRTLGLTVVEASVDPKDWSNPGVATLVRRATAGVRPGDILLFHDGGGHAQTLAALPQVLSILRARGFAFVTVSQLLRLGPPSWQGRP